MITDLVAFVLKYGLRIALPWIVLSALLVQIMDLKGNALIGAIVTVGLLVLCADRLIAHWQLKQPVREIQPREDNGVRQKTSETIKQPDHQTEQHDDIEPRQAIGGRSATPVNRTKRKTTGADENIR